ncbi:MAG: TonB-dependent receptor plug domain-containing protein, partial [Gemmatimonadota bacterium]
MAGPATATRRVTIVGRMIGYKPIRRSIALDNTSITQNFDLERDVLNLEQVIVTGTSDATSQKKTAFSVGVVDNVQLKEAPSVTPLGGLQGRVAGAQVTAGTGAPGTAPAIRLRGATSLTGRQDPLIIVDGTITRLSLSDINSEDIERVEVIKGAAASSLYGSDAANGVVQIFTKRGAEVADGRTTVTVRNEFGANDLRRTIPNNNSHNYQLNADGSFLLNS